MALTSLVPKIFPFHGLRTRKLSSGQGEKSNIVKWVTPSLQAAFDFHSREGSWYKERSLFGADNWQSHVHESENLRSFPSLLAVPSPVPAHLYNAGLCHHAAPLSPLSTGTIPFFLNDGVKVMA